MSGFILIVFIGLCLWLFPLAFIWAVNTLFGLAIASTLTNWFAALVLIALFGGNSRSSKD